jgi:outer membrane protein OmpA-like peptidoglycan-associated protein
MQTRLFTLAMLIMANIQYSTAQSSPELDKGDVAFNNFDFEEALYFYHVAHDASPSEPTITRRLAKTYRRMGDLGRSAEWYEKTIQLDEADPEDKLYYAEALKNLGRYDEAVKFYEAYNRQHPGDIRALSHLQDRYYYKDLLADTARYNMKTLEVNNENPIIGLTLFEDEKLLVSAVNLENGKTQEVSPFLDVYECDFTSNNEIVQPRLITDKVNSKFHDGPVFYSFSEKKLYITRNNMRNGRPVRDKNGNVNLKIYSSEYQNGEWTNATELKFNGDGYSTGHACISKDGKTMYLVSTREGGSGGSDIYQSLRAGSGWSAPINLGSIVNTPGNEMFPYISDDNTLYFASDGHAGLGGLDIFKCELKNGEWEKPINLGSPVNSSMDDFALVYDKQTDNGFFCSNRAGHGDDNIYFYEHVEMNSMILAGIIRAEKQGVSMAGELIHIHNLIDGTTTAQHLSSDERFEIKLNQGEKIEILIPGKNPGSQGTLVMTYEVPDRITDPYVIVGAKSASLSKSQILANQNNQRRSIEKLNIDDIIIDDEVALIPTEPYVDQEAEAMAIIRQKYQSLIESGDMNYQRGEFNSAIENYQNAALLRPEESYPNRQIEKIKQKIKEQELARYQRMYQNLIIRADEQFSKKEYESCLLIYEEAIQMMPAEEYPRLQIERVQQLLHPFIQPELNSSFTAVEVDLASMKLSKFIFEYNSSELNDEYYRILDGLITLMKQNGDWILVIESHTDSRGSITYNQQLSVERAQTVQKYMISKGISRDKLQAICYGESRLVNKCTDEVECSEQHHQENRRIEYKFVRRK